ncbi:MAG: endonuclease III [Dehalococcoidia bacterium]|nr:MAG: endonuclease III [Dehalococcoidia bacterium]
MSVTRADDAIEVMQRLERVYPHARIALNFSNPLELLVATILSAQSTDVGVNKVTPALFARYKSASDYANADVLELEGLIKSTGFYHNKAKSIMGAATVLVRDFGGNVPKTMAEIITLPGVARKTGNVVLFNAHGVTEGIAVDTHVIRLSNRLGLSHEEDPVKIEQDLMKQVPKEKWGSFAYLLIDHGRAVCIARNLKCDICVLNDICPSAFRV